MSGRIWATGSDVAVSQSHCPLTATGRRGPPGTEYMLRFPGASAFVLVVDNGDVIMRVAAELCVTRTATSGH